MNIDIRTLEETLLGELNASDVPMEVKRLILSDLLTMFTKQADTTIQAELMLKQDNQEERNGQDEQGI